MAVLIDTSVWIDHFRAPLAAIPELVIANGTRMHSYVIGELALGTVPDRARLLRFLASLQRVEPADPESLLTFIEETGLHGGGIGYVDVHLLKSCRDHGLRLWTHDKRLAEQAGNLGLLHSA